MTVILLVLSHGVQSGLAVCPLHLVEIAFHCCRRFDIYMDKLLYITHRFVYDFCIWKVDNESAHFAYSLLQLTFVRSGSFSKVGSAEGPNDICNHWLMHYKTLFNSVGYDSNIMEDIISGAATPTTGDFMFVRGS